MEFLLIFTAIAGGFSLGRWTKIEPWKGPGRWWRELRKR
jgi:hypothetical protein